jgi:4-hydroxyacetophenone monooxygenase
VMMDERLKSLVWSDPSVRSWHKDREGRVAANSPWRVIEYWQLTQRPDMQDYELER